MTTDPTPAPSLPTAGAMPVGLLKNLLVELSEASQACGEHPEDQVDTEYYSRLCDRAQIARARIVSHFEFCTEEKDAELAKIKAERDRYFSSMAGALHSGLFDKVTCKELREPGERLAAQLNSTQRALADCVEALKAIEDHHGEDDTWRDVARAAIQAARITGAENGGGA